MAIPAQAQIKSVQTTGYFTNPDGTTVTSSAFTAAPTVGDKIIVSTWAYGTYPTLTVTDNYGNSYKADSQGTIENAQSAGIYSTTVTNTGANFKITVSTSNYAQLDAVATEYSGLGPVDQTNLSTAKTSTPSVSTLSATSAANELVISTLSVYLPWYTNFNYINSASGYTADAVQLNNLNNAAGQAAEKTVSSTGVQSNSWTTGVSIQEWVAAIATYQQSTVASSCGALPSVYPVAAGSGSLNVGSGSQVNGTNISGTGTSIQTSGVRTTATPAFPALLPSSYPSFSSGTSTTASTVASGTYQNVTASGTTTFTGGTYYIANLTASASNTTLKFGPGTYYITNANLSGNTLTLVTTGAVTINVGSNFSTSSGMAINYGGTVTNLRIYLYPNASVNLGSSGQMNGIIYGPGTGNNVNVGSNFQLNGMIVVNANVTLSGTDQVTLSGSNATAVGNVSTCGGAASPDHYDVAPVGAAVNCYPEPINIYAHDASHNVLATTDTITLSTSTGHGDWSLSSGQGTFTAGASNSGSATYAFSSSDNGAVLLALRDTYPETVTVNVTDGSITAKSGSATASEDGAITFSPTGFRITNGSNAASTIATQIAGKTSTQSLAIQAIRTDTNTGACMSLFASGTTANVNLAYQCNNPGSCIAGQTLTVTNNGTSTGIAANGAASITNYTSVPLKFTTANAEAPITLNYTDVGQITLAMSYSIPLASGAASGNTIYGSSQFVVQPYSFALSGIKRTGDSFANPAASTASGTVFTNAGQPFTATVTAVNYLGAATPNYGRENSPQSPSLTPTLVLPAGGHNPAISGGFGSFAGGVATGTAFAWPEVGIVSIAAVDSNYLSTGAVTGAPSGNVGRFIPNGFGVALNTPVFATACGAGGFGYVGQPFAYTVSPVITATAQALGGATTQNYTGSLMRMTNSSLTGRAYTPTPASPGLNLTGLPATTSDPAIADLGAGIVSLTFGAGTGLSFNRGAAVAPFSANIALSINVIDLDSAAAANPVTFGSGSGISWSTSASQYYGRLALRNAAGSELLDLPMQLTTQYYAGAAQGFVTNTSDVCTTAPAIAFSGFQSNLNSGETCVRDSGSPGVSGAGCSAAASNRYLSAPAAGNFNLILASPGAGNNGAVTVTATTQTWLQYLWNASSGTNSSPAGMATFGVFPGPKSRIYTREVY